MRRLAFALYLTVSALVLQTTSLAAQQRYEDLVVGCIDVSIQNIGKNSVIDSKTILSRLKTRSGEVFSQADFDGDLKSLSNDYDKVEPSIHASDGQLFINLKLWPKPVIRTLSFSGNDKMRTSKLREELGVKVGTIFDRQGFNTAFHLLKEYYVKKGYFEAELEYTVQADPHTNNVDVEICIDEGRSGRVKSVVFEGFNKREKSDLVDMILTKKHNLFTSWLTGDGTYREEVVQQDQLIVTDYLQNRGFADAVVTINVVEVERKNRINIVINLERGEHYHFGTLTLNGNTIFDDDTLWEHLNIKKGDAFSPSVLRETSAAINNFYGSQGYIDAFVSFDPRIDPDANFYHIDFKITEGEQYRVGMINVLGNCTTKTTVILHESVMCPGDVFDVNKLRLTEQKLFNIGYFSSVNVYASKPCEDSCQDGHFRDVTIEVEEADTGSFSAFVGFSTIENIFGGLNISERNFDYTGIPCLFRDGYCALRGGGEYAHAQVSLGKKQTAYQLSWAKPFFMDTPWIVGFDVDHSISRLQSKRYSIKATGITVHAKYPINQYLKFGWQYRIRHSDVNAPPNASTRLLQQEKNSGLISGTGISLIYDSTNDVMRPSNGFRSRFDAEYTGLGGTHTFFLLGYTNTYYWQMDCNSIFKIRADGRFILPTGDSKLDTLPLDERFFLGGETTVRGYRSFSIGPRFLSGEPSGGLSQVLFSLEYVYVFTKKFDVFAFFDMGSLSDKHFNVDVMRSSWGYGARLAVFPNGPPLTIGMGYPINAANESDEKQFFLSLGARF